MINLTAVIDNDQAIKKLKELQNVAKTTTSSVVKDSERMDASFQKIQHSLSGLVAGVSFGALARQVVQVRGEVQQLEVAFETMLGSKERASKLLDEAIDLAAKTPLGLQDISNATKQLLAYGSSADEVTGEIKMLGNIAAGLSLPLGDLIYLYGTTRTQGRMFTIDLRQFMGRGIPLAEELAKQFGVTTDKVGELVTAGKVGFDDMAQALQAMSSEGGKFYNLMDKQSQTITGQISNLKDNIYQMFNAIGEKSEGIISGAISVASDLVENYERIGRALTVLVGAYGLYRAALIATIAYQKALAMVSIIQSIAKYNDILRIATRAQIAFNAAVSVNPYVLLGAAIAGVVALLVSQKNETERLREAEEQYTEAKQAIIEKEEKHNELVENLISLAENEATATDLRKEALHTLIMQYPEVFAKYETEADMLANIRDIKREIASIEAGRSITNPKNELADVERQILAMGDKYKEKGIYGWDSLSVDERISRMKGTNKDREVYRNLENRKRELQKEIRDNERSAYLGNLSGTSDYALDNDLKRLQRARDLLLKDGFIREYEAMILGVEGYDKQRIEAEIKIIEAEQAARKADKKSAKDWVEAKKKTYDEARKAYEDYITAGQGAQTQEAFEKQAQDLKDAMDMAKKEYQKYAVSSPKSKSRAFDYASLWADAEAFEASSQGDADSATQTLKEQLGEKIDAWNEYYKRYGDLLQKLYALRREYSAKIDEAEKADNMGLVATLKREELDAIEDLYKSEIESFGSSISDYSVKQLSDIVATITAQIEAKRAELAGMSDTKGQGYQDANRSLDTLLKKLAEVEKLLKAKKFESLKTIFSEISDVANSTGDAISVFNEEIGGAIKAGVGMIGTAISLCESIGKIQQTANAAGRALSSMEKASVVLMAISAVLKVFTSGFQQIKKDLNKEFENYEKLTEAYENLVDIWDDLIDRKREYLDMSYGAEAKASTRELREMLEAKIALEQSMLREGLNTRRERKSRTENLSLGGYNELVDLGLAKDYKMLSDGRIANGINWNKLLHMSPEELAEVRANAQSFWSTLDEDTRKHFDNIIAYGEQMGDIEQSLQERYTQMSFDDLYNNFFDTLMDMDATAEEVAGNVSEYFFKAMLFNQIGERYKQQLKDWYNSFADAMSDGSLAEEELNNLRQHYEQITAKAMEERDALASATGYSEGDAQGQSATSKGFQTMSQETGDELNGRFTDIQGQTHRIAEAVEFCRNIQSQQLQQTMSINNTVAMIHNDTSLIAQHTQALSLIREDIYSIRRAIDNGVL